MKTKIIALILISSLLSVSSNAAQKEEKKPTEKNKGAHQLLIPPQMMPLDEPVIFSCGTFIHMGLRFYLIRSTSHEPMTSDVEGVNLKNMNTCISTSDRRKFSLGAQETSSIEMEYDQVTCSRHKILGLPEMFQAASLNWKYLHPTRIKTCFEKLDEALKQLQSDATKPETQRPSFIPT